MAQPSPETKVLVVPLRSNAYSLVAGPGVAAMRRRLKAASLIYDRVYLERGRVRITVGPHGGFTSNIPDDPLAQWQTPAARSVKGGERFSISFCEHDPTTPQGVSLESTTPLFESETTYRWDATFAPFAREMPAGCDWMSWATVPPLTSDTSRLISDWTRHDMESPALRRQWPNHIVRSEIVKHVNRDLVVAAASNVAVTLDPLHRQVYESRFRLDSEWRPEGFVLPVVVPAVSALGWEDIAALRRHPGMVAFREVLREVEQQALDEAAGGDLEAAAHHAFERYLASVATTAKTTVRDLAKTHLRGLLVGSVVGAITLDWVGPVGFAGAVALGQAEPVVGDIVRLRRAKSKPSWLAAYQSLTAMPGASR